VVVDLLVEMRLGIKICADWKSGGRACITPSTRFGDDQLLSLSQRWPHRRRRSGLRGACSARLKQGTPQNLIANMETGYHAFLALLIVCSLVLESEAPYAPSIDGAQIDRRKFAVNISIGSKQGEGRV